MRTPKNEYDLDCYPHFCLSLFGDNRGLRFMCADFGWRTFLFAEMNKVCIAFSSASIHKLSAK